jgi:hypothetical protein
MRRVLGVPGTGNTMYLLYSTYATELRVSTWHMYFFPGHGQFHFLSFYFVVAIVALIPIDVVACRLSLVIASSILYSLTPSFFELSSASVEYDGWN